MGVWGLERRVAVVVEDDEDIRELMAELLGQSGFAVHPARTGAEGVTAVREHEPTVITVDLGLPDIDGYEVTRQVRRFSDAYIVMLTARTEEIDTLLGLEAGADDYITKPFRPRELRARIEAMLRRPRTGSLPAVDAQSTPAASPQQQGATQPPQPDVPQDVAGHAVHGPSRPLGPPEGAAPVPPPVAGSWATAPTGVSAPPPVAPTPLEDPSARARLELDGLALYPYLHQVEAAGREVPLTPTEFVLLETLLRSGQVVRSKAELARAVRGDDAHSGTFVSKADERTVEVHVGNLRRKLTDDPNAPRWIQTVRGVGYRMAGRPVAVA